MTITSEKPAPLVPPEVDLRGLDYLPFFGNHLFGSEFNARCSDAEWRAGVTLWWAAWNQQPAGSLPDDDLALCRLADLGRDLKLWRKIKDNALRGFVLCSDGRLYHRFLCKQVMVAWEKRVQERERKRKWREKRHGQDADGDGDKDRDETGTRVGTGQGRNGLVPSDGNGRDVTGRDVNTIGSKERIGRDTTPAVDLAVALRALGVPDANGSNPVVLGWAEQGITVAQAQEACRIAQQDRLKPRPSVRYLDPIVQELLAGRPAAAASQTTKAMQNLQAAKRGLRE